MTHFENGPLLGVDKISWSPDGSKIAFAMARDIHVVSVDGLSDSIKLTNTTDREESDPVSSRNLKHLIFVRNDSGRTLNGTVHFVLEGLDDSIIDGETGSTFSRTACSEPLGRPYKSTTIIPSLVWRPGQVIQIDVHFFNPNKVPVDYNLRIYTGPGNP